MGCAYPSNLHGDHIYIYIELYYIVVICHSCATFASLTPLFPSAGLQDPPDAPSDAPCDSAASTLPSLAQGLCFGPSAFGRIERARPSGGWLELEQKEVARWFGEEKGGIGGI